MYTKIYGTRVQHTQYSDKINNLPITPNCCGVSLVFSPFSGMISVPLAKLPDATEARSFAIIPNMES